jgi:maleylacetoacetate isomerase
MKPILYSYWRSSCSYRVRLALNFFQIDYDYKPVHLVKEGGEQFSSNFSKLNPKNEVPFYIDGEENLSESMSILLYLNDKYSTSEKSLLPHQSSEKYFAISCAEMINTGIQPIQNLKVLKYIQTDLRASDVQKKEWGRYWIDLGFLALEKKLNSRSPQKEGSFIFSSGFSLVECFLLPQVYNALRFGVDMEQFPIISKIYESCQGLEYVSKSIPENQIDSVT